jgi:NAD-dependent deacetylase
VLKELAELVKRADRIGILTGAGISAESGIPTFRGKDGLWNKYEPSQLATPEAFFREPELVWKWYLWRMEKIAKAKPNPGHYAISNLERLKPNFLLITQNVDGLHRLAGSKKLVELHGNIFTGKCRFCGRKYSEEEFKELYPFADREFLSSITQEELQDRVFKEVEQGNLPKCLNCGEIVGPGVVWFGESLEPEVLEKAFSFAQESQLFFSVGTSSVVQPAASIPLVAKRAGAVLVEVNPEETPISPYCDFVFRDSASRILPQLLSYLEGS